MTIPNYQALGTAASGTSGAVSPTLPTHAIGDLLILAAEGDNTNFGTTPTGYESRATVVGSANKLAVYTDLAATAAESNPTITPTTANHTYAQVLTVRNVHQIYPIHARAEGSANTNSVTAGLGTDTLVDDCLIVQIIGYGVDNAGPLASAEANTTITPTERQDAGALDGNGGGLIMFTGDKTDDGAVAQTTFTLAASTAVACCTLALAPIADITITGSVEIDGVPVATGGTGEIRLYDLTQRAATYLVLNEATADAAITISDGGEAADYWLGRVPYTDHEYIAIYTDETGNIFGSSDRITYSAGFPVVTIEIFTGAGGGLVPPRVGSAFIR